MADFEGGPGDDVINGTAEGDTVNGHGGNDQLNGLGGDDILNGGDGNDGMNGGDDNDTIEGGNGADVLNGDGGDDTLVASGQTGFGFADTAHGGFGSDRLVLDWSATLGHLQMGSGPTPNGTFGGFDGNFTDVHSRNVNFTSIEHFTIIGGADNDIVTVATGDDIVQLGLGNDFVNVGSGTDTADGGGGVDGVSADLSTATADILWNLQANTYSGPAGTSFANFEYFGTVSTGSGNDVIVTTNVVRSEVINLGDGDDSATVVQSQPGGGETVNGGSGSDRLIIDWSLTALNAANNSGPTANAVLGGFDGQFTDNNEVQVAYSSIEHFTITTGNGSDNLTLASGNDIVSLGANNDFVNVGAGTDQADGGADEDGISADLSSATVAILWNLQTNSYSGIAGSSFTNFEYFGTLTTGSGNDVIVTRDVNRVETINLGAGDDSATVTGRTSGGSDTVNGGSGSDRLIIDWSAVTTQASNGSGPVVNGALGGFDGNFAEQGGFKSVNYSSIEHFTITTGSGNDNIQTASGDDVVSLGSGDDSVNVGAGINTADGGSGIDGFAADFGAHGGGVTIDLAQATSAGAFGSYSSFEYFTNVVGSSHSDRFLSSGVARNDVIAMGAGNDIARVRHGNDIVHGGPGDDTLIIDYSSNSNNVHQVNAPTSDGNGFSGQIGDGVSRGVTFTGIDRLEIATGSGNDNVQGAGGDDSIVGGLGNDTISGLAGNDSLDGGAGADVMNGGAGNDTYFVNESGDQTIETAADDGAFDLVRSQVSFTLGSFVERLTLTGSSAIDGTGNDLANVVTGNNSANLLDGGAGSDKLVGKGGDDIYVVDRAGDKVIEDAGGGDDTVQSSVTYALASNLETLILTGAAAINGTGNFAVNSLIGNSAANTLNGGAGADTMQGGDGHDTYFVDNAGDQTIELSGEGTDIVRSKISFTIGDHVENLTLTGGLAIDGTGNGLANTINGNGGANILDGGAGADKLNGKGGNDTYVVDNAGDLVSEDSASGGIDLVQSSVTFTLGTHVDNLTLTGAGAIDGSGNATANTIIGNGAANILAGGSGNDMLSGGGGGDDLRGGLGNDDLEGGGGADDFVFDTALGGGNVDEVLDFVAGADRIALENSVFAGLPFGALNPSALRIGAAAADANDRIVYDPATGNLYFDSDGTGAAAQIQFATLDNAPATLSAADFTVI